MTGKNKLKLCILLILVIKQGDKRNLILTSKLFKDSTLHCISYYSFVRSILHKEIHAGY